MSCRVLIADEHKGFRDSLWAMRGTESPIEIVGMVDDAIELLAQAAQTRPDIICMDISMPGLDSIKALRSLLDSRAEIKIIGLSADADLSAIMALLNAGAAGYVSKKEGWKGLLRAILGVDRYDKTYLCPDMAVDILAVQRVRHKALRKPGL